jgi:hypothetical protein
MIDTEAIGAVSMRENDSERKERDDRAAGPVGLASALWIRPRDKVICSGPLFRLFLFCCVFSFKTERGNNSFEHPKELGKVWDLAH